MFKRRIVGAVLVTGLLLGMTGCGNSGKNSAGIIAESVYEKTMDEDDSNCRFKKDSSFKEIPEVGDFYSDGEKLYYYQYDSKSGDTDSTGGEDATLYEMDVDGSSEQRCKIEVGDNEYIAMMVPSDDGTVGIVISDGSKYRLLESNGDVMADLGDISSVFNDTSGFVLELYKDRMGYTAVMNDKIISYNMDFVKRCEVKSQIGCSCLDKDGNVVVARNERPEDINIADATTNIISVYNVEMGCITNTFEAKIGEIEDISTGSGDNDIYIYADDIYGMNYSEKTETKIVNLNDTGINTDNYTYVSLVTDDILFAAKNEYAGFDEAVKSTLQKYTLDAGSQTATAADAESTGAENEVTTLTLAIVNGDFTATRLQGSGRAHEGCKGD